jgi:nicotinate-nucleotide pyrophosphorylase (carboxylating)
MALREDFGGESAWRGDVTCAALIPPGYAGSAAFVARSTGVLAGLPAAALVCGALDRPVKWQALLVDGAGVEAGTKIALVSGDVSVILAAERTALNFLQRLSGVATMTRRYVDAVVGLPCQILDTRKTTPGWRLLEKYAVRCGGGHNHRIGLYDMVLIKDNHLAATGKRMRIADAVRLGRREPWGYLGHGVPVEIEVDTLEQFDEALAAGPDMILLDNMTNDQMREAVRRRNTAAPKILLEASGGVTLETVRGIAETGVDRISVGALTHSATALDIALDYEVA